MSIHGISQGIKRALESGWEPKTIKQERAVRIALEKENDPVWRRGLEQSAGEEHGKD